MFDIGVNHHYWFDEKNKEVMKKVAKKCYLPTNKLMLNLIKESKGKFRISYSVTGVAIEQFRMYAPEVLESFRELAKTGAVEFINETYYHSLAYLYSKDEFKKQVEKHYKLMKDEFGVQPKVFRNTELIYNNEIAKFVEDLGYRAIIAEGVDNVLGWRSPNFVYMPKACERMRLLLKNYKLSDDIAFRFSNPSWEEYPLSVEKFTNWLNSVNGNGHTVNLFMDYETFGEHQWSTTGIFRFLKRLPFEVLKHPDNDFRTVSEVLDKYEPVGELDVHHLTSWADLERDVSAWLGNKMQKNSIYELYALEKEVMACGDEQLIEDWRKLTTSDHFYYMCTKWFADGDVHKYFNPYDSPYDSFIAFMNILNDIQYRLKGEDKDDKDNKGQKV